MSFVLFFRGLIGVLLVFAITTYLITQSVWTTFLHTLVCAVLLQIGYFAAVLFLIWRRGRKPAENEAVKAQMPADDEAAGKSSRLPGVPRSPHS